MEEAKALNSVCEFHTTFGHPVKSKPVIPDEARCKLRVTLISEELEELQKAISDMNMVEIADALCDIQYVLSGAILEFGLGNHFSKLFAEVQRSNMSKACKTRSEAEETVTFYQEKENIKCIIKEINGKFLVYREIDNKVMKSIYYSPADLKSILDS
jgi:predicted HAD superfamily Cof-like phosphohydrolase